MKQSAKPEAGAVLSQALCASARNVGGICQTQAPVMRPAADGAVAGVCAKTATEKRRQKSQEMNFIVRNPCANSVKQTKRLLTTAGQKLKRKRN
jgi:hypothetical protein